LILWNPDLGYYLAVPNQTVSGASVKYDYNHIGANDVIVADFHSHASMSAFWSSTDEADDRNKTYYTGVIGKLNMPTPEYKLRFNYNEMKRECGLEEIFDIVEEKVEIPKEWMERVKISTPVFSTGKGKPGKTYVPDDSKYKGIPYGYGGDSKSNLYDELYGHHETAGGKRGSTERETIPVEEYETFMDKFKEIDGDLSINEATGGVVFKPASGKHEEEIDEIQPAGNKNTDYIDYLTIQYGEDTACAYDQAMSGLDDIEPDSCDEVLKRIIAEAYNKMSPTSKTVFSINE
jgi:hypothetical protein